MKPLAFLLSAIMLTGISSTASAETITKKDQKAILGVHNVYR
jgi:hypothetical protein